jgi:hypothetical protein
MSDPLPTEPAAGPLSEADREARIEQLLLSGLDQYFAGRYERAVNIWTRVAFLERGHSRARAYIERARGALAERQRETEELVHAGVEAYHAGELQTARDLLTRATSAGGTSDTALLFIERLERLDAASEVTRLSASVRPEGVPHDGPPAGAAGRRWLMLVTTVAIASVVMVGSLRIASSLAERPVAAPLVTSASAAEPLPIVRASDLRIARARELFEGGRPAEALRTLDAVDIGDPRRPHADRLRADIQRALLGLEAR